MKVWSLPLVPHKSTECVIHKGVECLTSEREGSGRGGHCCAFELGMVGL